MEFAYYCPIADSVADNDPKIEKAEAPKNGDGAVEGKVSNRIWSEQRCTWN